MTTRAKQTFSLILTLALLLTTAQTAWADITPATPSQDADGYYLIGTAAELYGFAEIVNNGNTSANAKLTADIVVNENVLDANGEANTGDFVQWTPIGNDDNSKTYSGTFDGQGHTISGLYVSGNGWYVGFVGQVSGTAVVKNLGIVDSYFSSSNNYLGSIVGGVAEKSSVTIANVYSTSTVKSANWIGGLVGGSGNGSVIIINSYFAGKTSSTFLLGEYNAHHDDIVSGDFDMPISGTLIVVNTFVVGTSLYGTVVTAEQMSDGTVAAALHYYQDVLADGSMFGINDGKTTFSGSLEGVSVTTADITLHTFDGDATTYSSKYVVGITTPLPVNVVHEGYTFLGWYDNANFEGDAVTQISSSETGNKEYWAKFVRSHSVSFVLNGGTIQKGEIDHYIEGETIALPTFVLKDGASFEGWYTTEDFTGDRYYSIPSTATEDMTFYAKWGAEKTTFYLQQGPEPVNVLYEGENVVYLDKTTMDGYYVSDEYGNYWGGFGESIDVPYTGGESTFGNGGRMFNVFQSGFYVFTLTDKGSDSWFISVLRSMNNCTVADIPDQTYTGSAIEPTVVVTNGETTLTLDTDYTIEYSDNTNAGTATVTIKGKGNYSGTVEKTFTIVPKPVTVTADNKTKEYGDDDPTLTATVEGLIGEDAIAYSLSRNEGEAVGTYDITPTGDAAQGNYAVTYINGTLTITPKPATYTITYELNGGTVSTDNSTAYTEESEDFTLNNPTRDGYTFAGWTGTDLSEASTTVTIAKGSTGDRSYTATWYQNVTLTAGSDTKVYNGAEQTMTGYTCSVEDLTFAELVTASGSGTNAGEYDVTFSGVTVNETKDNTGNYLVTAIVNGKLTISPASVTVTADNQTKEYGKADPTLTATVDGLIGDDAITYILSRNEGEAVGEYAITPTGEATQGNYAVTYVNGTLTVEAATIVSGDDNIDITQDENGYTVNVTSGDTKPINLEDGSAVTLTYSRVLTAPSGGSGDATIDGQAADLYTVCLPTEPATATNVKYYTLTGASGATLTFTEEATPAANTPYLVAVLAGGGNVTESATGQTTTLAKTTANSSSAGGYVMRGTLTGMTNAEAMGKYILQSGNRWGQVVEGSVYIPPSRAYIEATSGARELVGSISDGDATGIDSIRTTDNDGTERWYDLNGHRISAPQKKGMYIHNGRKEVRK